MEPTANEADLFEQQLGLTDEEPDLEPMDETTEADPADVQEQQRAVPETEDDER